MKNTVLSEAKSLWEVGG